MTTVEARAPGGRKTRKMLILGVAGAIVGAAAMAGLLTLMEQQPNWMTSSDRVAALGTALVYVLIGILVGLGTTAPKFGVLALNVENEAELRYERRKLLAAAAMMILLGLWIAPLALVAPAGEAGGLGRDTAGALVAIITLLVVVAGIVTRKWNDELTKAISADAYALAGTLIFVVFGGWAALTVLGRATLFGPLAFLSGVFALYLFAVFVAAAKRGALSLA